MTTPPFTVTRTDLLQDPDAKSFGAFAAQDGGGRLFLLIKSEEHFWGLWELVGGVLEARVVPLPGGKMEADASMIIHDNRIVIYYSARIGTDPRPAHECEVSAPGVRRMPGMAHVSAIYREIAVVKNNLTARLDALERALGNQSEEAPTAALEARVTALEGRQRDAGEILSGA